MNNDASHIEAKAETRAAARELREIYAALRAEGFDEQQTLVIIGQILAAGSAR